LLAWFAPTLVGPGDAITQRLLGGAETVFGIGLATFIVAFVIRFCLGAVSYAARTPGGLFAPLLVIGAQSGLLFGSLCSRLFANAGIDPTAYAVVGMAALFTAVVRAPITGIILAIELTGSFTLLLPMLAASFGAMVLPTWLNDPPIYESLRWGADVPRSARQRSAATGGDVARLGRGEPTGRRDEGRSPPASDC
jgi:CIC family chloride channel protein